MDDLAKDGFMIVAALVMGLVMVGLMLLREWAQGWGSPTEGGEGMPCAIWNAEEWRVIDSEYRTVKEYAATGYKKKKKFDKWQNVRTGETVWRKRGIGA